MTQEDDKMWEYVLITRLQPYVERAREWWEHYNEIIVEHTGVFQLPDSPPGMMYRVTNTPVRSPIKNVQVFPFVPVSFLNITGVPGGLNKMISRVCDNGITVDEFTIIEKSNLPSTYHQGQFLCIVPTDILNSSKQLGKFVYLTRPEMAALANGEVPYLVKCKMLK